MAFDRIPKIENWQFYIDVAFKRATNVSVQDHKQRQMRKIEVVHDSLVKSLERILHRYPQMDELDPFYHELFKRTLPYGEIKKALASVLWAIQRVKWFGKQYRDGVKRSAEAKAGQKRTEFYGRVNSIVKQIRDNLALLEEVRKEVLKWPVIKTGKTTVCITGFPNVGKTTLLSELTGSRGEIAPYAFTTTGINVGWYKEVQMLDTPGTLNREKMNSVELMAHLAMEYVADAIIYVFDPSEITYPLKEQESLYERIAELEKTVFVYVSKRDVIKQLPSALEQYEVFDKEQLRKALDALNSQSDKIKLPQQ